MDAKYIYISDEDWYRGYFLLYWMAPTPVRPLSEPPDPTVEYQQIKWPLPRHRVYEVVPLGDITYVLRRASDVTKAVTPEREGEQPEETL